MTCSPALQHLELTNTDLFLIDCDEGLAPVLAECGPSLMSLKLDRLRDNNNKYFQNFRDFEALLASPPDLHLVFPRLVVVGVLTKYRRLYTWFISWEMTLSLTIMIRFRHVDISLIGRLCPRLRTLSLSHIVHFNQLVNISEVRQKCWENTQSYFSSATFLH